MAVVLFILLRLNSCEFLIDIRSYHSIVVGIIARLKDELGRAILLHGILGSTYTRTVGLYQIKREEHLLQFGIEIYTVTELCVAVHRFNSDRRNRSVMIDKGDMILVDVNADVFFSAIFLVEYAVGRKLGEHCKRIIIDHSVSDTVRLADCIS